MGEFMQMNKLEKIEITKQAKERLVERGIKMDDVIHCTDTGEIKKLDFDFSICKVKDYSMINLEKEYCFTGTTDEEKSLVCITEDVPKNVVERDDGWKAFRIEGVLDFSLVGILSRISTLLAEQKIPVFAISTFNTDYILTKKENYGRALDVLRENGYLIR